MFTQIRDAIIAIILSTAMFNPDFFGEWLSTVVLAFTEHGVNALF